MTLVDFTLLLSFLLMISFVDAKVTFFRINARTLIEDKFVYIDKFCFDNLGKEQPGILKWNVAHPDRKNVKNITINVYDDEQGSWPALLANSTIDCGNIRQYTKGVLPLDQYMSGEAQVVEGYHHFWYLIIDACNYQHADKSQYLDISFTWNNPGGYFKKEFSFEKQGLLETMMFTFPVLLILFAFAIYNLIRLVMARILHFITRIYFVSLFFYVLHILLQFIFYITYGNNGYGVPYMDDSSLVFRLIAEVLFIVLLFLISSGWLITQPYIRHLNILAALLVSFIFVYTFLFVWVEIGIHTDTDAEYIFETTPGLVIGVLRLAALFIFVYSLRTTYKKEKDENKLKFYKIFGVLFVPWFAILPLTILLNLALPIYVRTKVIEGIGMHIEIIYYSVMLGLLWHSRLCKFFGITTANSAGVFNIGRTSEEQIYEEL